MPSRHPLYLMAKLPRDIAGLLVQHRRAGSRRADLLHMTLLPVGLAHHRLLEHLTLALHFFSAAAFRVCFDGVHSSGKTVALRGSETMRGAVRFQAALRDHLSHCGVRLPVYAFHPHITLAYRADDGGSESIDPISWQVEDIRLIESVTGEGRHIEHGRWRLPLPEPLAA